MRYLKLILDISATEKVTMKWAQFIIFFSLTFLLKSTFAFDGDAFNKLQNRQRLTDADMETADLKEMEAVIRVAVDEEKRNPTIKKVFEESIADKKCTHCPSHLKLTKSINEILDKMRVDPALVDKEEIPINIHNLKFLFYTVQARTIDGNIKCSRYHDITPNLEPTKFEGEMQLVAEDAYRFDGVTTIQVLDPSKEEVVYYYRGEGAQKNIIVQAVMNKEGGKFRYYYYRPSEREKNPYNLPALGEPEERDATVRVKKPIEGPVFEEKEAPSLVPASKDKMSFTVDPKLERRLKIIPKNVQIAKGELSQEIVEGIRLNANTNLSLAKGNEAQLNVQNNEGFKYVEVNVRTSITGNTKHSIAIPYEVRLGSLGSSDEKETYKLHGRVEDQTDAQVVSVALVDRYIQHFRTELRRDKNTSKTSLVVGRDFDMGKNEIATVAMGRDENHSKFISLSHKKSIKENVTMVLDVKLDEHKKATFMYQMRARF